jgi:hypothetical protein
MKRKRSTYKKMDKKKMYMSDEMSAVKRMNKDMMRRPQINRDN